MNASRDVFQVIIVSSYAVE